MAEKLGLGSEVRELKIGQSFTNPKSAAFHTVRYDFKPASVDTNKKASVEIGNNHQVTVTVPHLDGAGTRQTVFKGSHRPYTKECVLIIDRATGEITLEKLGCNIQVKKTRNENRVPLSQDKLSNNNSNSDRGASNSLSSRSAVPLSGVGHRVSNKTKVTSGSRKTDRQITQLVPKHSPLHTSPCHPSPNNGMTKSPKNNEQHTNNQSTLASLPMIGMDDFSYPTQLQQSSSHSSLANNSSNSYVNSQNVTNQVPISPATTFHATQNEHSVGEITDSSSSSSDSDSEIDPDNTNINSSLKFNGYTNGNSSASSQMSSKMSAHLLTEDLCLSESGSDSD